jgi:hypothetical protein
MILLLISGLLFLIFGYAAIVLPIAYRSLEDDSKFLIGFRPGAGLLNRYVREVGPFLNIGSKVLFLVSAAWFIYLLSLNLRG